MKLSCIGLCLAITAGLVVVSSGAKAQTIPDDVLADVRNSLRDALRAERFGDLVTSVATFESAFQVAGADFTVALDSSDELELSVVKLPVPIPLGDEKDRVRPLLFFEAAYLDAQETETVGQGADRVRLDTQWQSWLVGGGGGASMAVDADTELTGILSVAYLSFKNEGDFTGSGELEDILEQISDGLLTNFDLRQIVLSADIEVIHHHPFGDWDFAVRGAAGASFFETVSSTDDVQNISAWAQSTVIEGQVLSPSFARVGKAPIGAGLTAGLTYLPLNEQDIIGFEYYFRAGPMVYADISCYDLPVDKVAISAEFIRGENIKGASFGLKIPF